MMPSKNVVVFLATGALVITALLCHSVKQRSRTASPAGARAIGPVARGCGTPVLTDRDLDAIDRFTDQVKRRSGLTADVIAEAANCSWTIRVAFHVIHDGDTGNLTLLQVQDQIDALSAAYENLDFELDLDHLTYSDNPSWFYMAPGSPAETDAKNALTVSSSEYLNIYSVAGVNGLLGWSTFPWNQAAQPNLDGVVIAYASLPGNELLWSYGEGDTAVHEVGHWCGLYHPFQGQNCSPAGDRVADTPTERTPTYGCPTGKDSCPQPGSGLDPFENYMDYSDDGCMFLFTDGQYTRMAEHLLTYRPNALLNP